MALHSVPEFLVSLPKEDKNRLMKQYIEWKKLEITELLLQQYEKKLDQLILEDEKDSPLSLFQSKYNRAKRLGKREMLRYIIKNLQE